MDASVYCIEDYLAKPYWVIDILPKQVPRKQRQVESQQGSRVGEKEMVNDGGQYFKIEEYFLKYPRIKAINEKFTNILLKLNCYEDFDVSQDGEEWMKNPAPEVWEAIFLTYLSGKDMLYILLKSEGTLITVSGDDTYMTVYHPSEKILDLLTSLVVSEGLFIWKPSS